MAAEQHFTLKDKYTFLGEDMLNSYYYFQTEGFGGAEDLALAFKDTLLPLILEVQHTGCVHQAIEVMNLDDSEDFHTEVLTTGNAGTGTGETMPKWDAWGFRKNRANSAYRNGSIRIGGLAEGFQNGGVAESGAAEDLGTLAAAFSAVLEGSSGNMWELRTPSGSFVGGSIPVPTPISSVQYVRITTQNSRKR